MAGGGAGPRGNSNADRELYRADGVRITHDPYAAGMAAKYGAPGSTDADGFDPYADSVGAGIYGGTVMRDEHGAITIGAQYQGHNSRPGPVYSGGGYTPVSNALSGFQGQLAVAAAKAAKAASPAAAPASTTLGKLLERHPDLVNDVSTGGALPLHSCGMSQANQHAAGFVISAGGDIESVDTYGFTPLHRMASNNLPVGASALLAAGADPLGLTGLYVPAVQGTPTPLQVARSSRADAVIAVLEEFGQGRLTGPSTWVTAIEIFSAGYGDVIGRYELGGGADDVPAGFGDVCDANGWPIAATWLQLNGGESGRWFRHTDPANRSYIYFNKSDGCWWIDGPDGLGAYKAAGPSHAPPAAATAWTNLKGEASTSGPTLAVFRGEQP